MRAEHVVACDYISLSGYISGISDRCNRAVIGKLLLFNTASLNVAI